MALDEAVARTAALFDLVSQGYDRAGVPMFEPVAERLVAEVAPVAGERLLDIGCGSGRVIAAAAPRVTTAGRIVGIDVSPGMVERARTELAARGVSGVELAVMDGRDPDLAPQSFDVITSSLVLFFLPDPADAVRRWIRLLTPGGRVGVTTFGAADERWRHVDDAFDAYLPPGMHDARMAGQRGPFASDDGVEQLLGQAGFAETRTSHLHLDVSFDDADHWYEWTQTVGLRLLWGAVPTEDHAAVRAEASRRLAECVGPDGRIHLSQDVRVTVGRRPAT